MQITVTLNAHPDATPFAISQWFDRAQQIEKGPTPVKDQAAPVQTTAPQPAMPGNSPQADRLFNKLVETKAPDPVQSTQTNGFAPIHDGDNGQPVEQHSAPAQAPVQAEAAPAKTRGRKPSAATLAKRAAEAAAANTTAALQQTANTNGHAPPGMGQQQQAATTYALPVPPPPPQSAVAVQQPAMPYVPPQPVQAFQQVSTQPKSLKDVDALYQQVSEIDFRGARLLLRAPTWADGTPKSEWFYPEQIAPEHWDRFYGELAAMLPVNVQPAIGQ